MGQESQIFVTTPRKTRHVKLRVFLVHQEAVVSKIIQNQKMLTVRQLIYAFFYAKNCTFVAEVTSKIQCFFPGATLATAACDFFCKFISQGSSIKDVPTSWGRGVGQKCRQGSREESKILKNVCTSFMDAPISYFRKNNRNLNPTL